MWRLCRARHNRHFYAATATRLGVPILHVQRALGHTNLGTTQQYLARIAPEDTHDATRAAFSRVLAEQG